MINKKFQKFIGIKSTTVNGLKKHGYIKYIIKWKQKWNMKHKLETKAVFSFFDAVKTVDLFNMNGKHARKVCAECRKLQHRLYYQQNKEKTLEDNKEYSEANREIMLQ